MLRNDLEVLLGRDTFWLFHEMESSTRKKLNYDETHITLESAILFLKWYNKQYAQSIPIPSKRSYSTTHRIEVAYRTEYRCACCDMLLPPTFEIDHIIELRDGGLDEYTNLQALCPNCHSLKTRANTMKHDKVLGREFTARSTVYEANAFAKFKCKRTQKRKITRINHAGTSLRQEQPQNDEKGDGKKDEKIKRQAHA